MTKSFLFFRKYSYNDKKGSFYLLALLVLTVLYIMIMVFFQKILYETETIKDSISDLRAFYVAHAGLEDTIYELRHAADFAVARDWTTTAVNTYSKGFPGTTIASPVYQGTYVVVVRPVNIITENKPSTFNLTISGTVVENGNNYVRSIYAEGLWTMNKGKVYLTLVREE